MNHERFNGILGALDIDLRGLIEGKNTNNYATDEDALHNFRIAANDQGITMGQALRGMVAKHKVVVDDMASGAIEITEKRIQEHAVDLVVYATLLVPVLYEMMEEQTAVSATGPSPQVVTYNAECDHCSEHNMGYDRAIEILEYEAQHLRNLSLGDTVVQTYNTAVEILRKER